MWRINAAQFAAAVVLDLLLGDPRGWPHPARLTGWIAGLLERVWQYSYKPRSVFSGVLLWINTVPGVLCIYGAPLSFLGSSHPALTWLWETFVVYQCIAIADLQRHVSRVMAPLQAGDLASARAALAQIVGRDTAQLDETGISRAAIECIAESTCDGIVAPLFFAAVGGWPGALIYRAANTLDSMVGHRDAQYERFGKASARIDDVLNFFPARLAALCISGITFPRVRKTVQREAAAHASPNAGWPEAAMAHALGVRLGGSNSYGGVASPGPLFNPDGRAPLPQDIPRALRTMQIATAIAVALMIALLLLFHA